MESWNGLPWLRGCSPVDVFLEQAVPREETACGTKIRPCETGTKRLFANYRVLPEQVQKGNTPFLKGLNDDAPFVVCLE